NIEPVRHARKITVGRCLYLNVIPTGGRSWYYKFYFEGKCQKLMLGTYPEISLECAKSRHQYARNLIAQGIDPCEMKAALGKNAFVRQMRDWEIAEYPRGVFGGKGDGWDLRSPALKPRIFFNDLGS